MSPPLEDVPPPYGTVVFDCDSTLSSIEGVDELALLAGIEVEEIAQLTRRAMDGGLPLEAVYSKRLERIAPGREQLEALGRRYVETALPHAVELMTALTRLEKRVVIVSGGLLQGVSVLAAHLGVPAANVHAVEVFLDRAGAYQGFDDLSPLARSGGKLELLRELARSERGGGVALVGDGVTDLEAAPATRRFIAFAGVHARGPVLEAARVRCDSSDLAELLPLLATEQELDSLTLDPDLSSFLTTARRGS